MEEANSTEKLMPEKVVETLSEEALIRARKEKVVKFLKEKYEWVTYVLLGLIVLLAIKIRTLNLGGLKDITTGDWTLGPDLDPWLFWRMSKYIVENGSLFQVDWMRYVPLGFDVSGEYLLHPYMMAWFHKIAVFFGSNSVTQSAILYPVFFFAITVIAFFFMTRELFVKKVKVIYANLIALVASVFLVVTPALLPRTIAGIPEKESAAFFFMFAAIYFFMAAWNSETRKGRTIFSILAGLSTAGMAHIWGGYIFIFITIVPTVFFAFVLGKMNRGKIELYLVWLVTSIVFMVVPFAKHSLGGIVSSISTGLAIILAFMFLVYYLMYSSRWKEKFRFRKMEKIPPRFVAILVTGILIILIASVIFGPSFVPEKLGGIKDTLIKPATSRLIQTVAENKQPYFSEWAESFGPLYHGIYVMFWLFFFGSIYLFRDAANILSSKERRSFVGAYCILLFSVVFSRYASGSILNGENFVSKFIYGGGFALFVFAFAYLYVKRYQSGNLGALKKISFGFLLVLSLFFISLVAARAAVRTVMVLVPSASIILSYFVVMVCVRARKSEDSTKRVSAIIFAVILVVATLFAAYQFYKGTSAQAEIYAPAVYNQQWQKAMSWVRDSTPEGSVFGHWWDYGYWLQSIGQRATVLDGGNVISYWNHLMGRYALTGTSNQEALEFLYAHNATHFLIDSTDIGKYGAYSLIGSDVNYDRASSIVSATRDQNQVQEKKNSTVMIYPLGIALDEDIQYEFEGEEVFLPKGNAGIGAVIVEIDSSGEIAEQPIGIFVYQGNQYHIPLRYAYKNRLEDFGFGVESAVYIYPSLIQGLEGLQVDLNGALMYLSPRSSQSQLARLYLYGEESSEFELVHSEEDAVVTQIKSQYPSFENEIIYFQGIHGPIKIWQINYPDNIELKEEFLDTEYPLELKIGR